MDSLLITKRVLSSAVLMQTWPSVGGFAAPEVSVLIQPPETRTTEMGTFFPAAVFLLYSSFPVVPSRPRRCSLPKECGTSPWAGDILFHKVFPSFGKFIGFAFKFRFKMRSAGISPDSLLQFSSSGRIYRSFKAVRGLGMYLLWHGGSNWPDSSAHVEISLWRVWTSEECFVNRH